MTEPPDLDALRARLAQYEHRARFDAEIDEGLERALRDRIPLERTLPALLERLVAASGATGATIRTRDETLIERTYAIGAEASCTIEHPLDVVGENFGCVTLHGAADDASRALLRAFCERLDNYLASLVETRRRYEILLSISDALRDPALVPGIHRAIEILAAYVALDQLVLVFTDGDANGELRYVVHRPNEPPCDSVGRSDGVVDALLRRHGRDFLAGDDEAVREHFGMTRYREEVLITGLRSAKVVGRLVATSAKGEFHMQERELLERFVDYVRQRVVDFNREWRQLATVFSRATCERLLAEEGYAERWLTPREHQAAVLFCDISGFTRVSESVLRSPEAIGRFIHAWAERAVELVWASGGVFDKMVGDCIIAMWGPPFFDEPPDVLCRHALSAAIGIREHTRSLTGLPELAALSEPLDVASGLHFCPILVGLFGPNANYTGFSAGMNNCARLQNVARGGEILAMEPFVSALGEPARFGELRHAAVKNVRQPLAYRRLGTPVDRPTPTTGSADLAQRTPKGE